jgi:hypothetical protein
MRGPRPTTLCALAVTALVALAGCGSSDGGGEIPPDNANEMLAALGDLQGAAGSESCGSAEAAVVRFQEQVGALPDDEIRASLEEATGQLNELVDEEVCTQEGGATGVEETPPPTEEATEAPATTDTAVPEETEPEEEEAPAPTPEDEAPAPKPESGGPPEEVPPAEPPGGGGAAPVPDGGVGLGSGEGG